jgi:HK97 family phage prohead protease
LKLEIKDLEFTFELKATGLAGRFTGYGSKFGNMDSYREIVAPGAFKESLKTRKEKGMVLPILWQHRSSEPLGKYDVVREDDTGLYMEGQLMIDDIAQAKETYALIKAGVVNGLSIGYYVRSDSYDEKERIRTLTKLDLVETSIVTFPANDQARIDTVKSFDQLVKSGRLPTLPEFENFLREAGGFSKSQATVVAGHGLSKLLSRSESGGNPADALQLLKQWNFKLP